MVISNNLVDLNNYKLFSIDGGRSWSAVAGGFLGIIGGISIIATSRGNPFAIGGGILVIECGVMCIANS